MSTHGIALHSRMEVRTLISLLELTVSRDRKDYIIDKQYCATALNRSITGAPRAILIYLESLGE